MSSRIILSGPPAPTTKGHPPAQCSAPRLCSPYCDYSFFPIIFAIGALSFFGGCFPVDSSTFAILNYFDAMNHFGRIQANSRSCLPKPTMIWADCWGRSMRFDPKTVRRCSRYCCQTTWMSYAFAACYCSHSYRTICPRPLSAVCHCLRTCHSCCLILDLAS